MMLNDEFYPKQLSIFLFQQKHNTTIIGGTADLFKLSFGIHLEIHRNRVKYVYNEY